MGHAADRVAVVIVDWNAEALLGHCLDRLSAQSIPPSLVVVVDNAGDKPAWRHLRSTPLCTDVVRMPTNRGFAAACNVGIRLASEYDWIAMLNPDAFPEPNWLEELLRAADENRDHSSFASRLVIDEDPFRLDGTGDVYAVSGLAFRRDHGAPAAGRRLEREEIFGPCAAAALYRREALVEAAGFDESFFCYFEDVDLALRLRLAGHRCLYVPRAVVRHVGSAVTVRHSDFSVYHAHRNLVWTFVKNMPAPLLARYFAHHLLLNLVSIVHFALRGQARTILRAKIDAVRGLPRVWRQRRHVQAQRRIGAGELRRFMVSGWRAFGIGRFDT
jgi:GT2 family glycosyltransferase